MPEASSSAAGGRAGWQGVRFEAAFAVLSLIRSAKGLPPDGLDSNSLVSAEAAVGHAITYRPQSTGAVDDLVALSGAKKLVAYQAKSGLGQVPVAESPSGATADALDQAGRELREPTGAQVVALAFGRLSSPMRLFANWLRNEPRAPAPTKRHLDGVARALGYDVSGVDWEALRPRLRFLALGNVESIGARIDVELASVYASPADRLAVADVLKELVAQHSDVVGERLPSIDGSILSARLESRGIAPIDAQTRADKAVTVLGRLLNRFLDSVALERGPLPEIMRAEPVDGVCVALERRDVVLTGGGGLGKTEIASQVVRRHLAQGWTPVIVSRDDIPAANPEFGRQLGIGGRTDLLDVVSDVAGAGEKVLLLIDGLDEVRRIASPDTRHATNLSRILQTLRIRIPGSDRVRILVSCRAYDWTQLATDGLKARFAEIPAAALTELELAASDPGTGFSTFLSSLDAPLREVLLQRPILLRLAFELWLSRGEQEQGRRVNLDDVRSEVDVWLKYYEEVVCASEQGLASGATAGEVRGCHDAATRAHVQNDRFALAVLAPALETRHPRAYSWLRSLEVLTGAPSNGSRFVRFFHPAYADFSLAQLLAGDAGLRDQLSRSLALSVSLFPVWERVPAFLSKGPAAADEIVALLNIEGLVATTNTTASKLG